MIAALSALLASRKSIVGIGGLILVGLVYFFGEGDWAAKSTAMAAIAGIAVSIITAIGREDAAEKSRAVTVVQSNSEVKQ